MLFRSKKKKIFFFKLISILLNTSDILINISWFVDNFYLWLIHFLLNDFFYKNKAKKKTISQSNGDDDGINKVNNKILNMHKHSSTFRMCFFLTISFDLKHLCTHFFFFFLNSNLISYDSIKKERKKRFEYCTNWVMLKRDFIRTWSIHVRCHRLVFMFIVLIVAVSWFHKYTFCNSSR